MKVNCHGHKVWFKYTIFFLLALLLHLLAVSIYAQTDNEWWKFVPNPEDFKFAPNPRTIGIEYALDVVPSDYGKIGETQTSNLRNDVNFEEVFRRKKAEGKEPHWIAVNPTTQCVGTLWYYDESFYQDQRHRREKTYRQTIMWCDNPENQATFPVGDILKMKDAAQKVGIQDFAVACFMPDIYEISEEFTTREVLMGEIDDGKLVKVEVPDIKITYNWKDEHDLQSVWNDYFAQGACSAAIVPLLANIPVGGFGAVVANGENLDEQERKVLQERIDQINARKEIDDKTADRVHWIFRKFNNGLFKDIPIIPYGTPLMVKTYLSKYKDDLGNFKRVLMGINRLSGHDYGLYKAYNFPPFLGSGDNDIFRRDESVMLFEIGHHSDIEFDFIETVNSSNEIIDRIPYHDIYVNYFGTSYVEMQREDKQLEAIKSVYFPQLVRNRDQFNNLNLFVGGFGEGRNGVILVEN